MKINIINPTLFACAQACTMKDSPTHGGVFILQNGTVIGLSNAIAFEAYNAVEPFGIPNFSARAARVIPTHSSDQETPHIDLDANRIYINDMYTCGITVLNRKVKSELYELRSGFEPNLSRSPTFKGLGFDQRVMSLLSKTAQAESVQFHFTSTPHVDENKHYAMPFGVSLDSLDAEGYEYTCTMMPICTV